MSNDSGDKRVAVLQWAIGLTTAILLAAVPWAFNIGNDVASIKTTLQSMKSVEVPPKWFLEKVESQGDQIDEVERKVIAIERDAFNGNRK